MIALKRDRIDALIPPKYRGAGKLIWDKKLLEAKREVLKGTLPKILFNSAFWTEAKEQLKKECSGKCAYCEAPTDSVAHGDVEHFRPKSIYWWLAYTYENYLFSCQICNQTYKSDNFPIAARLFPEPVVLATMTDVDLEKLLGQISPDAIEITKNYTLATFLKNHKQEKALLINPYYENPELYLAYQEDDTLKEVRVIAPNATKKAFTQAMIDNFGLNRPELLHYRYGVFRAFRLIKIASKRSDLPADFIVALKQNIEVSKANNQPFAGMIRFFDKKL
jgi:hypothetical protein